MDTIAVTVDYMTSSLNIPKGQKKIENLYKKLSILDRGFAQFLNNFLLLEVTLTDKDTIAVFVDNIAASVNIPKGAEDTNVRLQPERVVEKGPSL